MWYKIDIFKFAFLLLPPPLRKKKMFAFLKVLTLPISYLHDELMKYRDLCDSRLSVNGQVIYIEKALNDYFLLQNKDIYITDITGLYRSVYLRNESPSCYFYYKGSQKHTYLQNGTENVQLKFIVNVPSYLKDRIEEIKNIVEYNKPAGRVYTINIYDYE